MLVIYDADFKYGQNFYIALTEEAKDKLLNVSIEIEGIPPCFVYWSLTHYRIQLLLWNFFSIAYT